MSSPSIKAMAEKRVRRQKQIIAVGAVVLLAILGFELPKVLKHKSSATSVVTTAAPTSASAPGSAAPAPAGKLPDTDRLVVQRDTNQLLSFGLFKSKDPFVQQINPVAPGSVPPPAKAPPSTTVPAGGGTPGSPGSTTPTGTVPASTTPSGEPTAPPTTTLPGSPTTAPSAVLVSTNGVCEQVSLNGTFPVNEGIFRLAWIATDGRSIKVGVVGGSFDSGQATATVKLGEKLTLVNTADGTRYVIALEAKCDVVGVSGPTGGETVTTPITPPTTTVQASPVPPATTTTTTTATTPIVTDASDTTVPSG